MMKGSLMSVFEEGSVFLSYKYINFLCENQAYSKTLPNSEIFVADSNKNLRPRSSVWKWPHGAASVSKTHVSLWSKGCLHEFVWLGRAALLSLLLFQSFLKDCPCAKPRSLHALLVHREHCMVPQASADVGHPWLVSLNFSCTGKRLENFNLSPFGGWKLNGVEGDLCSSARAVPQPSAV